MSDLYCLLQKAQNSLKWVLKGIVNINIIMLLTKGNSEARHFVRLHKTEKLILSVKGLRKSHCVTQLRSPLGGHDIK